MDRAAGPILIVEDDTLLALDLSDILESAGYQVLAPAFTNVSACQTLKTMRPAFAILDYNLGVTTSVETARELCALHVPFIYLTGNATALIEDESAPHADILPKPFTPDDVLRAIEHPARSRNS